MKEIKARSDCPISYSLDFFGDKWVLLIIRDIVLYDKATFGEFLGAKEQIATNILTDRLKMLESEGFILRYPVPGKSRIGYCLTERGTKLIPILVELAQWGASENKLNDNESRKDFANSLKKNKPELIRRLIEKHLAIYTSKLAQINQPEN